jgi:CHAT domain-containing protein
MMNSCIRKLGIVPFGFLHDLAFAALVCNDDTGRRFLIEDHTIFYIPSATFFHTLFASEKPSEQMFLSFGINGTDEEELQPLRFAEEEASVIASLFNGQSRINSAATETELKQLAPCFK